jgi:tetratricopeptide (TPR) repeat protein
MESLEALRRLVENSADGKQVMANEYVNLAAQMQARIERAPPEAKGAISRGFEMLLERVAATASDRQVLLWTAESFARLGRTNVEPSGKLRAGGQRLVGQALEIYTKILSDPDLDEEARKSLRLRLAVTLRDMRQFEKSIDAFVELLSRNESQVHIQIEAARTYQQWGDSGIQDAYAKAITGDRMIPATRQNLLWGWGKLSQLLGRDAKFRELFFEARYNLALCRFKYAMMMPKPERPKWLKMAYTDIVFTARSYQDLGGEERKRQFDELLKQIQQAQGESPLGLK